MDWIGWLTHWLTGMVGFIFGLFWAGRRRNRMDYQTAMNIVWEAHCPAKKEPLDAL